MEAITIYTNNKEETRIYKQLAKKFNNVFKQNKDKDIQSKKAVLDGLSDAIQQVKDYEAGKIKLQTADDFFNEL